jgi:hypothetical protein
MEGACAVTRSSRSRPASAPPTCARCVGPPPPDGPRRAKRMVRREVYGAEEIFIQLRPRETEAS